jgi:hypothetical protein
MDPAKESDIFPEREGMTIEKVGEDLKKRGKE